MPAIYRQGSLQLFIIHSIAVEMSVDSVSCTYPSNYHNNEFYDFVSFNRSIYLMVSNTPLLSKA
jgi:hypothetical protein